MDPSPTPVVISPEQWSEVSSALTTVNEVFPYVATLGAVILVVLLVSMVVGWARR